MFETQSEDQWAVSSTWLEHLAFNQRVAGSKAMEVAERPVRPVYGETMGKHQKWQIFEASSFEVRK